MTLASDLVDENGTPEPLGGGWFDPSGRSAAVRACVPILSHFFSADSSTLISSSMFANSTSESEENEDYGIQFRIAIAAARRVIGIVNAIVKNCSFKYGIVRTTQQGYLSARIDLPRWVRTRGLDRDGQPVFPVQVASRSSVTSENVLAYWALSWMRDELNVCALKSGASSRSTEFRHSQDLDVQIRKLLAMHPLSVCRSASLKIRSESHIANLLSESGRRVRRREVANFEAYNVLLEWVAKSVRSGVSLDAGDIEWAFYDRKFDRRLFELWCLSTIKDVLVEDLAIDDVELVPGWRNGGLSYRISHFSGSVSIYFQRALENVNKRNSPRWIRETGRRLTGIPDIVVEIISVSGRRSTILIDPKLRQRDNLPGEEVHKMIGYLDNYELSPRIGILALYSPNGKYHTDRLVDGRSSPPGQISVVRLDPADVAGGSRGLQEVSVFVLGALNLEFVSKPARCREGLTELVDADRMAENRAVAAVDQLLHLGRSGEIDVKGGESFMKTLFGGYEWSLLSADLQIVLSTAFVVGNSLRDGDDFSGPVLGMCSALEGWLRSFCSEISGGDLPYTMLGQLLGFVEGSASGKYLSKPAASSERVAAEYFMSFLGDERVSEIATLLPGWWYMNRKFRRPAAHYGLVDRSVWSETLTHLIINREITRSFACLIPKDGMP